MTHDKNKLSEIVKNAYDLKVEKWMDEDTFDESFGSISRATIWTFADSLADRYKLVEYEGNFPQDDERVQNMKDVELSAVKEYQLVKPKSAAGNYCLYQLIPHTVQGKPVW